MSKVIRLTESDLTKLVKRVIKEQFNAETQEFKDEINCTHSCSTFVFLSSTALHSLSRLANVFS